VRTVDVVDEPIRRIQGPQAAQRSGLEITLDGARYTRLIVSLDHPDTVQAALIA
jgi:hypothetical protein